MLKNLKLLRTEANISQQKLADILMLSQQSINKYENHNIEPDIKTLISLSKFFDVSIDYLVGNTESRTFNKLPQSTDLTNNEITLLKKYNQLNEMQQQSILNHIDSYFIK